MQERQSLLVVVVVVVEVPSYHHCHQPVLGVGEEAGLQELPVDLVEGEVGEALSLDDGLGK